MVGLGVVVGVDAEVLLGVGVYMAPAVLCAGAGFDVRVAAGVGSIVVVGVGVEAMGADEGVGVAGTDVAVGSDAQEISISRGSETTAIMPGDFIAAY